MSCQHETMCCISTGKKPIGFYVKCLIVLECTHVQGKNPNRELSETDENVTFKLMNSRLFKR